MNGYKLRNKLIIFYFTSLFLLANDSYAVDMGILQEQCAEIGFKMKTPANGKCVLRLMKSVANEQTVEAAPKTPAISSTTSPFNMECQTDKDCYSGLTCRSKTGGGTECRAKTNGYIQQPPTQQVTQQPIQQPPTQQAIQQPIQQQNEGGLGTTLLQGLGGVVQLLGAAAQGYSQGRQSAHINTIQLPRTAHCNSAYSSLSKSVDTTCTQY